MAPEVVRKPQRQCVPEVSVARLDLLRHKCCQTIYEVTRHNAMTLINRGIDPSSATRRSTFCGGSSNIHILRFNLCYVLCQSLLIVICHVCRLLKPSNTECTNCMVRKDIEAVRHPKMYVLVKEVTKEVRMHRNYAEFTRINPLIVHY